MQNKQQNAGGALRILVSLNDQEAIVERDGRVLRRFPVSTSRLGPGFEEGSYKTPTGRFSICEKIGGGAPLGMIYRGRRATGEIARDWDSGEGDLILSRILRLDGLDPANSNTLARYVYFHGTNQERFVGQPASHGCIRMRNSDIAELFDIVPVGTIVEVR